MKRPTPDGRLVEHGGRDRTRLTEAETFDRVIAAAWPARSTAEIDGWTCRLADGVTRRANSALAIGCPDDLSGARSRVERFYRDAHRQPNFLVSDGSTPTAVEEHLVAQGYRPTAATRVLVAVAPLVVSNPTQWSVDAATSADDEWIGVYRAPSQQPGAAADAVVRDVLLRPAEPTSFVSLRETDGTLASVGQLVVVDGWGCIQCLATTPGARRMGAGRAAVLALMAEGRRLGAQGFVAAVAAENAASLGLFTQLGFAGSHTYAYYR